MSTNDPVEGAANAARIVVHLEMAYDVVDEMASNPRRYVDSLYKLSRLAAKVLNDIERWPEQSCDDKCKEALGYARRVLSQWAYLESRLIEHFGAAKDLDAEVKRFAALAVAPDQYSTLLKEKAQSV